MNSNAPLPSGVPSAGRTSAASVPALVSSTTLTVKVLVAVASLTTPSTEPDSLTR